MISPFQVGFFSQAFATLGHYLLRPSIFHPAFSYTAAIAGAQEDYAFPASVDLKMAVGAASTKETAVMVALRGAGGSPSTNVVESNGLWLNAAPIRRPYGQSLQPGQPIAHSSGNAMFALMQALSGTTDGASNGSGAFAGNLRATFVYVDPSTGNLTIAPVHGPVQFRFPILVHEGSFTGAV